MLRRRGVVLISALSLAGLAVTAPGAAAHPARRPRPPAAAHHPVVLYASDGMRPDLMKRTRRAA